MARYIGPKPKISRKFGEPLFGADKSLEKKNVKIFDSDKFEESWEEICKMLKLDPEPRLQSN